MPKKIVLVPKKAILSPKKRKGVMKAKPKALGSSTAANYVLDQCFGSMFWSYGQCFGSLDRQKVSLKKICSQKCWYLVPFGFGFHVPLFSCICALCFRAGI